MPKFNALVLRKGDDKVSAAVEQVDEAELPQGEVLVRVDCSTVNYKDGLILGGLGGFTRNFPHVPGIDFAGTVEESHDPSVRPGDKVVMNGWGMGENRWGGYAQKARVKAGQLVKLPDTLDTARAMAIGTAGYTAMLAINALERHGLKPAAGTVLVTGAAGGVGSVSVALLSTLGYRVAASTGRPEQRAYLEKLGAAEIVDREELARAGSKPLDKERWAACIDSVGGTTLATVLTQIGYRGAIAACGLAGGREFATTVLPFILRGVALLGTDSVMCPLGERILAWERLGRVLPLDLLDSMTEQATLADLPRLGAEILKGQIRGRVVIDVNR